MTTPQTSVQLYSVYKPLREDLDGTLRTLAQIGYRNVEAFDFTRTVPALKEALTRHGLSTPTGHAVLIEEKVHTPDGLLEVPPLDEVFEAAAELGIATVIDPYLPPARWADADSVKRNADDLNSRAERAREFGLRVGYHNHDHELRTELDGSPALLGFAELLEPTITLEVDLYWVAASGNDPVEIVRSLGDRVLAVHVKDGPIRPTTTSASLPTDQLPAGRGDVPLAAAIAAATDLRYAVVEFDNYAGDILDGVAESYGFLAGMAEAAR